MGADKDKNHKTCPISKGNYLHKFHTVLFIVRLTSLVWLAWCNFFFFLSINCFYQVLFPFIFELPVRRVGVETWPMGIGCWRPHRECRSILELDHNRGRAGDTNFVQRRMQNQENCFQQGG
jgi:hypothetical protein